MKCNIARDLMPLYTDGLCEKETERELEEHLAECKECSALKDALSAPVKNVFDAAGIKPFKKINGKFKRNIILIVCLSAIAAAILFMLGGLTYGELNKGSGYISFSKIFRNIEVKNIVSRLANSDLDGFSEYLYKGNPKTYSAGGLNIGDELIERFKAAYNEEIADQKCVIVSVDSEYGFYDDSPEGAVLTTYVTLDFERSGVLRLEFFERENGKYRAYIFDDGETVPKTAKALNFMACYDALLWKINLINVNPEAFVPLHAMNGITGISEKYAEFTSDGSEIENVLASTPICGERGGRFYSSVRLKLRDGGDGKAYVEYKALLGDEDRFSADMSSVKIENHGMSEEKIRQLLDVLEMSAEP